MSMSRMMLLIKVGDGDNDDVLVPKHTSHILRSNIVLHSTAVRDGVKNYAFAQGSLYLRNVLSLICAVTAYLMIRSLFLYIISLFKPIQDNPTTCILPS